MADEARRLNASASAGAEGAGDADAAAPAAAAAPEVMQRLGTLASKIRDISAAQGEGGAAGGDGGSGSDDDDDEAGLGIDSGGWAGGRAAAGKLPGGCWQALAGALATTGAGLAYA